MFKSHEHKKLFISKNKNKNSILPVSDIIVIKRRWTTTFLCHTSTQTTLSLFYTFFFEANYMYRCPIDKYSKRKRLSLASIRLIYIYCQKQLIFHRKNLAKEKKLEYPEQKWPLIMVSWLDIMCEIHTLKIEFSFIFGRTSFVWKCFSEFCSQFK